MENKPAKAAFLLYVTALAAVGAIALYAVSAESGRHWEYRGEFHDLIGPCDRIVVRDGGFDCCGSVDGDKILYVVNDPEEVAGFKKNLVFEKKQEARSCKCCGYPGMDWYAGAARIALTSVKHGKAIRYSGAPGDALLTPESARWLCEWLERHGTSRDRQGK